MAKYEILYIIRPNIEEEAKKRFGSTFWLYFDWQRCNCCWIKILGKNVVLHTKSKISVKDFTTSLTLKQTTMQLLKSFDRLSKINADILRHMIVKTDA